jgi:elongation factor P hydroxylase
MILSLLITSHIQLLRLPLQFNLMHDYNDLITLFNECFEKQFNTRLVCGADEPIYLPADAQHSHHRIFFAHGFFSSALHECAHWFIAGEARRQQIDYGYWYEPDGRTVAQQILFQQVEVKPQAIEWMLSMAAQYPFHFSIDNLDGEDSDHEPFKAAVREQVLLYKRQGLPARAQLFHQAISRFFGSSGLSDGALPKDVVGQFP